MKYQKLCAGFGKIAIVACILLLGVQSLYIMILGGQVVYLFLSLVVIIVLTYFVFKRTKINRLHHYAFIFVLLVILSIVQHHALLKIKQHNAQFATDETWQQYGAL
ncbi:hypothetical protein MKI79_04720 [Acinetobacter sp. A3.8]|uniref:Uncharacterized protein n=1 Tax=Acinetobacter sedimenti TaxID=2919922 RepID=A0A9X2B612_9GAMM|nr:hypothetical protein [Acinetobacter sedimenti]MCJ8146213.1 hypothetical protein [Acinetobacter sedimenti]